MIRAPRERQQQNALGGHAHFDQMHDAVNQRFGLTGARSRNDQVAVDIRMWLRDELAHLDEELGTLQSALVALGFAQGMAAWWVRQGRPEGFTLARVIGVLLLFAGTVLVIRT